MSSGAGPILVPRPEKRKIIKSKCVFKPESCPDGSILKLKVCLVAMGYTQEKGIDFDAVFSDTTCFETLRLVLSPLAARKWAGYQLDLKTVFLNSKLDQTIYISKPPGYGDAENPDWICEVVRSLYGLKKALCQCNKSLNDLLVSLGLCKSKFDSTLYFKTCHGHLVCAIAVHANDLAIVGEEDIVKTHMDQLEKVYKVGKEKS